MSGYKGMTAECLTILPVKRFERAKQRLSEVLSPAERAILAEAMFRDVLGVLCDALPPDRVVVVTDEDAAAARARARGVPVLFGASGEGQSAAVTRAVLRARGLGLGTILTVPADVPLLDGSEISELLGAHGSAPAVTLAPARNRLGTNGMVLSPPDVLSFGFGADSFRRHLEAARAAGLAAAVCESPGFGLDIDTPEDLAELVARGPRGHTLAALRAAGIAERLAGDRLHALAAGVSS